MEISVIALAALTVGLVEMIKQLDVNKKLIPLLALLMGIGLTFLGGEILAIATWQEKVLQGLILGLSAMGLYSGGKTLGE